MSSMAEKKCVKKGACSNWFLLFSFENIHSSGLGVPADINICPSPLKYTFEGGAEFPLKSIVFGVKSSQSGQKMFYGARLI